jgi:hypothetical protein
MTDESNGSRIIGTLMEGSLHAALKEWYALPGDVLEAPVENYVVDLYRDELLIEIQTSNFAGIRKKLLDLTERYTVRLVYPIACEKWIVRMSADGQALIGRRKSPKRGRLEHVFDELVRFPQLVACPRFSLEVVLTQEEEVRWNDGRGSWRRKGWSIQDRRLLAVVDQVLLSLPSDFLTLLPPDLPEPFTNRELANALDLHRRVAQRMTYCMRKMGVLHVQGKRRNALLYAPV